MRDPPVMTMGEFRPAQPVFPPAMTTLRDTTTGPARWAQTRAAAAVLALGTVVLVIVGSFLPLYRGTMSIGSQDIEVTITPWSGDVEGVAQQEDVPTFGYPLVFAAIILAVAAAVAWYAATPAATPGAGRVAGVTTGIGSAFLIGTVWTTALVVANGVDAIILLGTVAPGLETEATYLVGFWLLIIAAVAALAAAVLALIPVREQTWHQANPDVATPPYGLALPLPPHQPGAQHYPAAPHHPGPPPGPPMLQVDPLTGQPLRGQSLPGQPLPTSPPGGFPAPAAAPPPPPAPAPTNSPVWQTFPDPPAAANPPAAQEAPSRPAPPEQPTPAPAEEPAPAASPAPAGEPSSAEPLRPPPA